MVHQGCIFGAADFGKFLRLRLEYVNCLGFFTLQWLAGFFRCCKQMASTAFYGACLGRCEAEPQSLNPKARILNPEPQTPDQQVIRFCLGLRSPTEPASGADCRWVLFDTGKRSHHEPKVHFGDGRLGNLSVRKLLMSCPHGMIEESCRHVATHARCGFSVLRWIA